MLTVRDFDFQICGLSFVPVDAKSTISLLVFSSCCSAARAAMCRRCGAHYTASLMCPRRLRAPPHLISTSWVRMRWPRQRLPVASANDLQHTLAASFAKLLSSSFHSLLPLRRKRHSSRRNKLAKLMYERLTLLDTVLNIFIQ